MLLELPAKRYSTIVIDPPWPIKWQNNSYTGKNMPYPVMAVAEIASMPISQLCSDNAYVFLWTTVGFLEEALHILKCWRLQYVTMMTGCKSYGLGRPPLTATEHIIVGRTGQPPRGLLEGKQVLNWFKWGKKLRHSEKPDIFYKTIEKFTQEPRLDLFSRKKRNGWDCWGNECSVN